MTGLSLYIYCLYVLSPHCWPLRALYTLCVYEMCPIFATHSSINPSIYIYVCVCVCECECV